MNYVFGFLEASNDYLCSSLLHLYMSEIYACKINHDSYHIALNHIFIRLLQSWMSHSARQSLQDGRVTPHDIGQMPCLDLFSLLLSLLVDIRSFRCSFLGALLNPVNKFQFTKTFSLVFFSWMVLPHMEKIAHKNLFLDFSF